MFGWRIARVDGDSMSPTLLDGDYVFARKNRRPTTGAIALIEHPTLGQIVKRIDGRDDSGRYRVRGDNVRSTSSDALGALDRNAIEAVVRWRVSPSGLQRI